jgi:hypothetical protein
MCSFNHSCFFSFCLSVSQSFFLSSLSLFKDIMYLKWSICALCVFQTRCARSVTFPRGCSTCFSGWATATRWWTPSSMRAPPESSSLPSSESFAASSAADPGCSWRTMIIPARATTSTRWTATTPTPSPCRVGALREREGGWAAWRLRRAASDVKGCTALAGAPRAARTSLSGHSEAPSAHPLETAPTCLVQTCWTWTVETREAAAVTPRVLVVVVGEGGEGTHDWLDPSAFAVSVPTLPPPRPPCPQRLFHGKICAPPRLTLRPLWDLTSGSSAGRSETSSSVTTQSLPVMWQTVRTATGRLVAAGKATEERPQGGDESEAVLAMRWKIYLKISKKSLRLRPTVGAGNNTITDCELLKNIFYIKFITGRWPSNTNCVLGLPRAPKLETWTWQHVSIILILCMLWTDFITTSTVLTFVMLKWKRKVVVWLSTKQ